MRTLLKPSSIRQCQEQRVGQLCSLSLAELETHQNKEFVLFKIVTILTFFFSDMVQQVRVLVDKMKKDSVSQRAVTET